MQHDPHFSAANPILAETEHRGGRRYLTPGAAATLPGETRAAARAPPRRSASDTDQVLAEVLGLSGGEIARLHDAGLVASAP